MAWRGGLGLLSPFGPTVPEPGPVDIPSSGCRRESRKGSDRVDKQWTSFFNYYMIIMIYDDDNGYAVYYVLLELNMSFLV